MLFKMKQKKKYNQKQLTRPATVLKRPNNRINNTLVVEKQLASSNLIKKVALSLIVMKVKLRLKREGAENQERRKFSLEIYLKMLPKRK